jgi:hypothetical protein
MNNRWVFALGLAIGLWAGNSLAYWWMWHRHYYRGFGIGVAATVIVLLCCGLMPKKWFDK